MMNITMPLFLAATIWGAGFIAGWYCTRMRYRKEMDAINEIQKRMEKRIRKYVSDEIAKQLPGASKEKEMEDDADWISRGYTGWHYEER